MELPPLAIVIVTYNRRAVLAETLASLSAFVRYAGPTQLIIGDDGSDDGTQAMIATDYPDALLVQSHRVGLGANTNAALRAAFTLTPLVYQSQDDMVLLKPLDLTPHATALMRDETTGFIRLWGVGGHRYTATLDDAGYWRISWSSDELYIPSDRPHLKHARFHDAAGFYPEGLRTDQTEEVWCHQVKDRALAGLVPSVLIPHAMDVEYNYEHRGWHDRWRDKGL